jgi:hypothetical protein
LANLINSGTFTSALSIWWPPFGLGCLFNSLLPEEASFLLTHRRIYTIVFTPPLLKNYSGSVVSDAYRGYAWIKKDKNMKLGHC